MSADRMAVTLYDSETALRLVVSELEVLKVGAAGPQGSVLHGDTRNEDTAPSSDDGDAPSCSPRR